MRRNFERDNRTARRRRLSRGTKAFVNTQVLNDFALQRATGIDSWKLVFAREIPHARACSKARGRERARGRKRGFCCSFIFRAVNNLEPRLLRVAIFREVFVSADSSGRRASRVGTPDETERLADTIRDAEKKKGKRRRRKKGVDRSTDQRQKK